MLVVLRRFWIQITSDRKRFGVLCAMLALGLLLWSRIIVTSNLPRTAVAGDGTGPDPLTGVGPRSGTSDKSAGPPVRVRLARLPDRDPFLISEEHFPKPTPVASLNEDPAKAPPNAAEKLEQELKALVKRFELEAVMQGRPMAVINGTTYRLYDLIPAVGNDQIRFMLAEVKHRSVILRYEDHRFELQMEYPGEDER